MPAENDVWTNGIERSGQIVRVYVPIVLLVVQAYYLLNEDNVADRFGHTLDDHHLTSTLKVDRDGGTSNQVRRSKRPGESLRCPRPRKLRRPHITAKHTRLADFRIASSTCITLCFHCFHLLLLTKSRIRSRIQSNMLIDDLQQTKLTISRGRCIPPLADSLALSGFPDISIKKLNCIIQPFLPRNISSHLFPHSSPL